MELTETDDYDDVFELLYVVVVVVADGALELCCGMEDDVVLCLYLDMVENEMILI